MASQLMAKISEASLESSGSSPMQRRGTKSTDAEPAASTTDAGRRARVDSEEGATPLVEHREAKGQGKASGPTKTMRLPQAQSQAPADSPNFSNVGGNDPSGSADSLSGAALFCGSTPPLQLDPKAPFCAAARACVEQHSGVQPGAAAMEIQELQQQLDTGLRGVHARLDEFGEVMHQLRLALIRDDVPHAKQSGANTS